MAVVIFIARAAPPSAGAWESGRKIWLGTVEPQRRAPTRSRSCQRIFLPVIFLPSLEWGAPGVALDDALLIGCGTGAVRILRAQREGRGPVEAAELLRGFSMPAGTRLG